MLGDGLTALDLDGEVRLNAGFDGLDDRVRTGPTGDCSGTVIGDDRGETSAAGSAAPPKTTEGQPSCHPATAPPPRTIAHAHRDTQRPPPDRRRPELVIGRIEVGQRIKPEPGRVALMRRGGSGSGSQPGGTTCRSASSAVDSSIGQPQERQYRETILFNCSQTGH